MLKDFNKDILKQGNKLRTKLLFDISEKISYDKFFKAKFFKTKVMENITLKFI